jgi:hypothetical protein
MQQISSNKDNNNSKDFYNLGINQITSNNTTVAASGEDNNGLKYFQRKTSQASIENSENGILRSVNNDEKKESIGNKIV